MAKADLPLLVSRHGRFDLRTRRNASIELFLRYLLAGNSDLRTLGAIALARRVADHRAGRFWAIAGYSTTAQSEGRGGRDAGG